MHVAASAVLDQGAPPEEQPRPASSGLHVLRWAVFVLGALVSGQAALGFLGLFAGAASAVLLGAVAFGAAWAAVREGALDPRRPVLAGWRPLQTGLLAAVATAIVAFVWTGAGRTPQHYDSLSFHLYFPASWMDAGRLEIVPMVFGDVAPAYNPSNVELLIHLLMAPLASPYLVECAQAPFALIAVLAIYAAARDLGAERSPALAACLAFLLIPEVWFQATASMVDLAVAALFLATLPFLLRLWRAPARIDILALACTYGLFVGTKPIALPYSAPLLLAACAVFVRHRGVAEHRRMLAWIALIGATVFATGGFWYVRNLLVTSNPIFPLRFDVLGIWQLPGLYDAALMRQWAYHVPVSRIGELGAMLLQSGIGFAAAGLLALIVRVRGPETPLALALLAIFWLWIPYQHSRFLFAFFGVVAVALACAATSGGRAVRACRALLAAAVVTALLGWPAPERLATVAAGLVGAGLPRLERVLPLRVPLLGAVLALATLIALGLAPYRERYPGYAQGPELRAAWRWVHDHVAGAHVAYTGSNLPFPLYGRNLSNRVSYANVALGHAAKVHDFPQLEPATTAEPTAYRDGARFDTWLANLRALGCDTLFVSAMFPIVRERVEHDAQGFPVERAWADAHPQIFRLLYASPGVRIYAIAPAGS